MTIPIPQHPQPTEETNLTKDHKRYTHAELERALDLVEQGYSHAEVCEGTNLNKSIIAREMRKRCNEKCQKAIDAENERINKENIETFLQYKEVK